MMKHYYYLIVILVGLCISCGGDDDVIYEIGGGGSNSNQNTTEVLSVDERPNDWTQVTTDIDPRSSMAVDVAIDLSQLNLTYETDSKDMVAAFIDGSCRAVAAPDYENVQKADSADCVFLLTVRKLTTDAAYAPVQLKFYSAKLKHIFTTDTFQFVDEGIKGTISDPYKPQWQK